METIFFSELLRSIAATSDIELAAKDFSRKLLGKFQPNKEDVHDCLVDLKNKIGGDFKIESQDDTKTVLTGCKCPFGNPLGSPELCRVTETVFQDLARSCCDKAEVEITEAIARGDSQCRIEIHLPE